MIETPTRRKNWFNKRWKNFLFGGGLLFSNVGILVTLGTTFKGKLFTGKPEMPNEVVIGLNQDGERELLTIALNCSNRGIEC